MKTLNYLTLFCFVFFSIFIMNSCDPDESSDIKESSKKRVDNNHDEERYKIDYKIPKIELPDVKFDPIEIPDVKFDPIEIPEFNIPDYIADGSTPWKDCFGRNIGCNKWGCSEIVIEANNNDPVIAIIKKNGKILKHAYISAGSSYSFELKNGIYQAFFYYGTIWDKDKEMNSDECSDLRGGFRNNESVIKSDFQDLYDNVWTISLTERIGGNMPSTPSSIEEAL